MGLQRFFTFLARRNTLSSGRLKLRRLAGRASRSISYPLQLSSVSQNNEAVYQESIADPKKFWGELAKQRLEWVKEFDEVMDCDMEQGRINWFNGGKINASGKELTIL